MKHQFTKFAVVLSALAMLPATSVSAQTADFGFSHRGREAAAPNPQVRKATPRQQAALQTLVWGWCGEADVSMMGPGPDKDMWIVPMVGLTPNLATKYAGAKIKSVLVARGDYREANPVMNIVVAHGEQSLSEWDTPTLTLTETLATLENQDISAGNPGDWMEFELPEPIEIKAGVPIYAGYEYKVLSVEESQLSLCAVSDGILNDEPNSSWMDVKAPNPDTGELESWGFWSNCSTAGAVAMKRMNEKYPDNFVGVAVHSDDEMAIDEYYPFLDRYINSVGYPYCTVDRAIACDPRFDELEPNFLKEAAIPALVKLNVDKYEIDGSTLKFDAGAEFALSEADVSYAWAFVVTEDNVGPLPQQNYYTDGSLEGWDYTTNPVLMKFNEVAVAAESVMGDEKALITSTTAGQTVKLSGTIYASKVADWNNTHLVVMMLDTRNGQVQNSYKCKLWTAGVDSVAADKARVEVLDGVVTLLSGDSAVIYTEAGAKVAELTAGASVSLPRGLYIIECDGQARKVLVR